MNTVTYSLKISQQGQITLPQKLRNLLGVTQGSRIAAIVTDDNVLKLSNKTLIEKHFGTMPSLWTKKGQDAADYTRNLRNAMQPK
jgi:bifunctional DNA-binding transcriptional regulator/antitoxin component of YhaV-PrlF toxin-antitoxin module